MTKTEEIDLYSRFVSDLPTDSYLGMILGESVEWVADQIRSDIALPDTLTTILEHRRQEEEHLQAVRQQLRETQQELRRVEQQLDRARNMLSDIRTTAEHLATRCRV